MSWPVLGFCCLLFWFSLILTACQGASRAPVSPAEASWTGTASPPSFTSTAQPAAVQPPLTTPTAILAPGLSPSSHDQRTAEIQVSLPDPLRFTFPTPGPVPVSAWRPPLYPIPWAPTPFDHFYFARPIAANEVNWPLADYRYGGVFFGDVVHTGVDIPADRSSPVLAAGPGKVAWAGYGLYAQREDPNDPYGLAVAIKHDFGYQGESLYTVYGHMEKIFVAKGQHVESGDTIGLVGDTGMVTGVHLHFEVRIGKNNFFGSRNPELWVSPPQGWGILAARVMDTSGQPLEKLTVRVHSYDTDQSWEVNTYGHGPTNSDPYYRENLVMGDLPAGNYEVWVPFAGTIYNLDVQIQSGMVTYFTFRGRNGFISELPATPGAEFVPPTVTFSLSLDK